MQEKNRDPERPRRRILLVDDDASVRSILVLALRRLGLAVETAEDGRRALEMLGGDGYDLLLIDRRLPEVDGLEVVRLLRKQEVGARREPLPVVVMSGGREAEDQAASLEAGADEHLGKPAGLEELAGVMRRLLGHD